MLLLYNIGVRLYYLVILFVSLFNTKAKLWITGRKNWSNKIPKIFQESNNIWFHFASLGEFEQGKPVLEALREKFPNHKTIITFFSPSGYENKKNYQQADLILYLPLDTKRNAQKFLELIEPKLIIFTKYDYWYYYLNQSHKKQIPIVVISAIFNKNQIFFKPFGQLNRKMLSFISHFFIQDKNSATLLQSIGITNYTVVGDTRFDTVYKNLQLNKTIDFIENFKNSKFTVVAGSTWPQDEEVLKLIIQQYQNIKLIIAPHEISIERINKISKIFNNSICYSQINNTNQFQSIKNYNVLIIDSIGKLSQLYKYADLTYVGGGFGNGIHNTLEAAVYGKVVLFGPNYAKFNEAKELINLKVAFSINKQNFKYYMDDLLNDSNLLYQLNKIAQDYIIANTGATNIIVHSIECDIYNRNL